MIDEKTKKLLHYIAAFCESLEAEAVRLKRQIKEVVEHESQLEEDVFERLNWQKKKSSKLGEFEIAAKNNNDPRIWGYTYQMLKTRGATIRNRLTSEGWMHTYWLFNGSPNLIFRQKRGD